MTTTASPLVEDYLARLDRAARAEVIALLLLVLGFPRVLGWLVGAVLAVRSRLWSKKQQLLALVLWPLPAVGLWLTTDGPPSPSGARGPLPACFDVLPGGPSRCLGAVGSVRASPGFLAILAAVIAIHVLCAVYLYRAAGRRSVPD
jgi:hypothetical protein